MTEAIDSMDECEAITPSRRNAATSWIGFVGVSTALVAGCMPARFTGYLPVGPGVPEAVYCVAGIKDRLRIEAPAGVEIFLRADAVTLLREGIPDGRVIELDAYLTVPDQVTVRLLSPTLNLESHEWPRPRQMEITRIMGAGPTEYGAMATLTGSPHESGEWYSLDLGLPGIGMLSQSGITAPTQFTLRMPAMEINGESFDMEAVHFNAYEKWGVLTCIQ